MLDSNQFRQRVLNLYLNADFIPFSYNLFISGQHSYLGYLYNSGLYPKAAIFDFDGVFEFPDTLPLYKLFILKLFEENRKLELRARDIESCIQIMQKTGDIPTGEQKLARIYIESGLTGGQCENAKLETIKEFRFVRNAKKFISRIKYELGYVPGIISGSPQMVLEPMGEIMGMDKSNVYGSEFRFDEKDEKLVGISLRLNFRKLDAQNVFLQKFVNNMYGCRFFFTDDYAADAPLMKLGLNPAILIGKFKEENVSFDMVACCPEARENMLNLIPRMYRFEFGYVVVNSRTKEEEQKISDLALEVREIAREAFTLKSTDFFVGKGSFVKKAIDLYTASEKFIAKRHYIKERILRLMIIRNEDESKELMSNIAKFFRKYVAESHAQIGWLN
jgi:hypothetical protein